MNKVITGMMGFDHSDIDWEKMDVVAEIKTGGTDSGGFAVGEVFGLAVNQYDDNCLYLNTIDSHLGIDKSRTLIFGEDGKDIPTLLRMLADAIENKSVENDR